MGMEKLVSIGERLEKLLAEAEREAKAMIVDAEKRAEEMISRAKTAADRRRSMAQRRAGIDDLIKEAEKKAMNEANKIMKEYETRAENLKAVPDEKMDEAVSIVLKEVLPT